jgi:hypothetical protein
MTSALLDLRHSNMQPAMTRHKDCLQFARTDHTIADGVSTSSYQWPSHTADSVAHLLVFKCAHTHIANSVLLLKRLTVSTWSSWRHSPVRTPHTSDSVHLLILLTVFACSCCWQCLPAYFADNVHLTMICCALVYPTEMFLFCRPCNFTPLHSLTGPAGSPFASRLGGQWFTSQGCTNSQWNRVSPVNYVSLHYPLDWFPPSQLDFSTFLVFFSCSLWLLCYISAILCSTRSPCIPYTVKRQRRIWL